MTGVRAMIRNPLVPVAVKAALAAALAWAVVQPFGGLAGEYRYYAPLGAVIAVSTRVTQSVRTSLETLLAITLGAGLALAVAVAALPHVLGLGLVVGLGTLIGAWKPVGGMASWVPISALFILIIGGEAAPTYTLFYLGLTSLGALIGVAVNLLAPPLPLIAARTVQDSLRAILADELEALARGLDLQSPPTSAEWSSGQSSIRSHIERAQELASQTIDSPRVNWRARRWKDATSRQYRQGQELNQLAFVVEGIIISLSREEHADLPEVALGPDVRPFAARAFRTVAVAVRSVADSEAGEHEFAEAMAANDAFADAVRSRRHEDGKDWFEGGALVRAIRRVLLSMAPR